MDHRKSVRATDFNPKLFEDEINWTPEQKSALFQREILQPLYDEYMSKFATSPNPSAYDFFVFLLKQVKKP